MPLTVTFWGTRGSIPCPGPGTVRYGGNTACLTVEDAAGHLLVLDAGTGIRGLGRRLAPGPSDQPRTVTVLLTHTHWDHIQGLPFFLPRFGAGDEIRILGPAQPTGSLEAIVHRQMEQPVFPIGLLDLDARVSVTEIRSPEFELGHFVGSVMPVCHPGVTIGFSIGTQGETNSLIYLTDNELTQARQTGHWARLVRFLRQAGTLVHDAMYFESERPGRRGWGHSSAVEATLLALEAECRRVVLFHHDPGHDDQELERLLEEALVIREREGGRCEILLATEGQSLEL